MRRARSAARAASLVLGAALAAASAPVASAAEAPPSAPYCAQEVSAEELSRMSVVKQQYRGGRLEGGDSLKRSASTTLPDGTRVEVEYRTLRIIDSLGAVTQTQPLFSGYDFSGWNAIHRLSDDWLYVRGAQFDHALRMEQRDGRWSLGEIVRVRERDDNVVEAGLRWLLGMDGRQVTGDRLDGLVAKGRRRSYSPALRSVLFLEDGEAFEQGRFVPIGKWRRPMLSYYADLPAERVALLRDFDGTVHSYDGRALARLGGPPLAPGLVSQPLPGSRTFLGSGWDVFEVRGEGHGKLRLVKLVPADGRAVGWFVAVVLGGGELLFVGLRAVYELAGDELRPVWRPSGDLISGPMDADRLADGRLVVTTKSDMGGPINSIRLLAPCQNR